MAQRAHHDQLGRRADRVEGSWTRRRLLAAGLEPELASDLADDSRIDLHELLGLVDGGCPPALAVRIVWPLDGEPPS